MIIKNKNFKGFSLIEASLALAIITIFMSLGMSSTNILSSLKLQSDAIGVFQALKRAQSLALSPRPIPRQINESICGFGVEIESKTYKLVKLSGQGSDPCSNYTKSVLKSFRLQSNNSLEPTGTLIFYKSPYLETQVQGQSLPLIIVVSNNTTNAQIKLYVSNYGIVKILK